MKSAIILIMICISCQNAFSQVKDTLKNNEKEKNEKYCAILKDGIMVLMKNGISSTTEATLRDGSKVTLDGNVLRSDGINITLKNGECIDMNGNIENVIVQNPKPIKSELKSEN